jgi:hypothetical protein
MIDDLRRDLVDLIDIAIRLRHDGNHAYADHYLDRAQAVWEQMRELLEE